MNNAASVVCTDSRIEAYEFSKIDPVECWDDFGSELNITGSLPDGIYFSNNTFYGTPLTGSPLFQLFVVSQRDLQNPFVLFLGGIFSNCSLF